MVIYSGQFCFGVIKRQCHFQTLKDYQNKTYDVFPPNKGLLSDISIFVTGNCLTIRL